MGSAVKDEKVYGFTSMEFPGQVWFTRDEVQVLSKGGRCRCGHLSVFHSKRPLANPPWLWGCIIPDCGCDVFVGAQPADPVTDPLEEAGRAVVDDALAALEKTADAVLVWAGKIKSRTADARKKAAGEK